MAAIAIGSCMLLWLVWPRLEVDAPVIFGLGTLSAIVHLSRPAWQLLDTHLFSSPTGQEMQLGCWMLGQNFTGQGFAAHGLGWLVPFAFWFRTVSHVVGHRNAEHLWSNLAVLILVGPACEAHFGSAGLAAMVLVEGAVTTVCYMLTTSTQSVSGLSGVVFMLTTLASFVRRTEGRVPLSLLLVLLVKGKQEYDAMGSAGRANVAHLGHAIGVLTGMAFGFGFA